MTNFPFFFLQNSRWISRCWLMLAENNKWFGPQKFFCWIFILSVSLWCSLKINRYQLVASIGNHHRSLGINVRGFRGLLLLTNLRHDESLTKQIIILHCTAANEFTFSRTSKILTIQEHRPPRITLMPQYLFQDQVILLDSLNTQEAERFPFLSSIVILG